MRPLSLFVTICILFISSLSGIIKPAMAPTAEKDCCMQMKPGTACHHKKASKQDKDCGSQGCATMFACSDCGFLVVEQLTIQPAFAPYHLKPIPLYKIGDLSAYYTSNWKPPKMG